MWMRCKSLAFKMCRRNWRCPDQIEQWVAQDAALDQERIIQFTYGQAMLRTCKLGKAWTNIAQGRLLFDWRCNTNAKPVQALIRACRRLVRQFLMKIGPHRSFMTVPCMSTAEQWQSKIFTFQKYDKMQQQLVPANTTSNSCPVAACTEIVSTTYW